MPLIEVAVENDAVADLHVAAVLPALQRLEIYNQLKSSIATYLVVASVVEAFYYQQATIYLLQRVPLEHLMTSYVLHIAYMI